MNKVENSNQYITPKCTQFIKPKGLAFIVGFSALIITGQVKAQCWNEAAAMYGHDPYLLKAIGWKESKGYVGAVGSLLKDGNRALGVMQINTIHLPELKKHGIYRSDLFDPCTSIKVGAWVLADCLKYYGEVWRSVGCYYGGKYSKAYTAMRNYSLDVKKHYQAYKKQAGLSVQYQPTILAPNTSTPPQPQDTSTLKFDVSQTSKKQPKTSFTILSIANSR